MNWERGEQERGRWGVEVRELLLTPLGYGTNACSNGSLITNYCRGIHTNTGAAVRQGEEAMVSG